jgi:hypothetical protein
MKNRIPSRFAVGLLLAWLPFASGDAQTPAAVAGPQGATGAVGADAIKPIVADKDAAANRPLPANIPFTPALADVVRMAEAGIDENVILAFITNSTSTFNPGSDQIIYLNDLGISGQVITVMIQHDQALIAAGAAAATASTVPAPSSPPTDLSVAEQSAPGYIAPEQEAQPAVVNYNYFYDSLSPYGTWANLDGYGWCWQPTVTVIQAGWSPYCDHGQWFYSDLGWYWQSDYSWGAIAFHYGRWFCHPRWGWCWWPDLVWGPAWVTWRYSDDYCGWAPLAPATYFQPATAIGVRPIYTFVPWKYFIDRRPADHRILPREAGKVFDSTMPHENLPLERVAAITRSQAPKVTIRDVPAGSAKTLHAERPQRENGQLVVYRPSLPASPGGRPAASSGARGVSTSAPAGEKKPPATRPDFSDRARRTPPAPGRSANIATPQDKAPPGSIILIGRGNEPQPVRQLSKSSNMTPTPTRPSFNQNEPTPQPPAPQMASAFGRPSGQARVERADERVVLSETPEEPTPTVIGASPAPQPETPQTRVYVPPQSRTETLAPSPSKPASPPPAPAHATSGRSSGSSEKSDKSSRDGRDR